VGVGALLLSLNPTLTLVANSEFGFKCLHSPCSEDGILRVLTRNPQSTGSKCTRNEFATSVNFAVNRGNLYPARYCYLLLSNCRVADCRVADHPLGTTPSGSVRLHTEERRDQVAIPAIQDREFVLGESTRRKTKLRSVIA
jgi:hypothetical protein